MFKKTAYLALSLINRKEIWLGVFLGVAILSPMDVKAQVTMTVNGTNNTTGPLLVNSQANQIQLQSYNVVGKSWRIGTNIGASGANRNLTIWEQDLNKNVLTILQASGKIGIGTVAPKTALTVKSSIATTDYTVTVQNNAGKDVILAGKSGEHGVLYVNDATGVAKVLLYSAGASYFMGGNVGIGQSNPLFKLDVNGTANISGELTVASIVRCRALPA